MSYFDYISNLGVTGYFLESYLASIFILPPSDFIYVPIALNKPEYIFVYAFIGFILSVLGGLTAYMPGKYGGRPIFIKLYKNKRVLLNKYVISYQKHAFSIVFGAALFFAPYNICSTASGIFKTDLKEYITASVTGRALRFFTLAPAVYIWGETIKEHLIEIGCFFGFIVIPVIWIIEIRKIKKTRQKNEQKVL